jgi:hypothetical protein
LYNQLGEANDKIVHIYKDKDLDENKPKLYKKSFDLKSAEIRAYTAIPIAARLWNPVRPGVLHGKHDKHGQAELETNFTLKGASVGADNEKVGSGKAASGKTIASAF